MSQRRHSYSSSDEEELARCFQNRCSLDYEHQAEALREAMEGAGTDEETIIRVTAQTTNVEKQGIKSAYKQCFGRDLTEDMISETSGDFEKLLLALWDGVADYEAKCLRKAMDGLGTDEKTLYEIITSHSSQELLQIRRRYEGMYGRNLEKDLKKELSGDFERFLVALINCNRDQGRSVDFDLAKEDAIELFEAGELILGTDESTFIRILATRNDYQLRRTFRIYKTHADKDIREVIKDEFSGDICQSLLAFVEMIVEDRPTYFAQLLNQALKGLGTDDKKLIRIIASRREFDLHRTCLRYSELYGRQLIDDVRDDTSGDYRRLLTAILSNLNEE